MTKVFVWAAGQDDNVGDSVLRRVLVDSMRALGPVTVYVGPPSPDYTDGLALQPADAVLTSGRAWLRALVLHGGRRPVVALNAGELQLIAWCVPRYLLWLAAVVVARLRGGSAVLLGGGIRRDSPRWRWPLLAVARLCRMVRWRDPHSPDALGVGGVMPDWAFLAGPEVVDLPPLGERTALVVSMRGDRPVQSDLWVRTVGDLARRHGWDLAVTSQVVRDDERTVELARRLGGRALPWGGGPHAEREREVRDLYRRAAVVVSDRMHGLVIALTEGAVPVALVESAVPKIQRAFDAIGPVPSPVVALSAEVDGYAAALTAMESLVAARPRTLESLAAARRTVTDVRADVVALGGGRSGDRGTGTGRRVRVLHSLYAPDGRTRFVDQMVGGAPAELDVLTFSWWTALTARYDVFHVHWPESLLRHTRPTVRAANAALSAVLLARLSLTRTPVVRTMHNLAPHEPGSRVERAVGARLHAMTRLWIRLNPTTPVPDGRSATILHGHYRDRFARYSPVPPVPGRLATVGLIKPYKGIENLLDAFRAVEDPELSLRVVGKPVDPRIRAAVSERAADDPRVGVHFEFVPDEVMVREVREAELVVLPYMEMHNSGAALVALSLGRPVLVPEGEATRALADEVGPGWVQTFDGPLRSAHLERALQVVRTLPQDAAPELSGRDWSTVGRQHLAAYRALLAGGAAA